MIQYTTNTMKTNKSKSNIQYNVIAMSNSGMKPNGQFAHDRLFIAVNHYRPHPLQTAQGILSSQNNWGHRNALAPVHGCPMKASDTLLAGIMRSNKSWGAYLCGQMSMYMENRAETVAIRNCRNSCFERIATSETDLRNRRMNKFESLLMDNQKLKGQLLGIEIEFYPSSSTHQSLLNEARRNDLVTYGSDGSLRSGGMELRKLTWKTNGNRLNGLLGIGQHLVDRCSYVDTTCGLHVHVDVRNLAGPDREMAYDRACLFYPFLKKLIPKSRLKNKYCQFVNNRPGSPDYQRPRNGERYGAINWCSVSRHGTIEFRMGSASTNLVKIESWALLCQWIVNWCTNPDNRIPHNWSEFIAILPQWLSSWCVLRNQKLYGDIAIMDERVASAADSN